MDSMLLPVSPIQTKPMVVKINGKPLNPPIELTEDEEESVQFISKAYAKMFPFLGTIYGVAVVREVLQKTITLFKEQEDSIAVLNWFGPKEYIPHRSFPDLTSDIDLGSIQLMDTSLAGLDTHLVQPLTHFLQLFFSQFSLYVSNLFHSGPVFIVVLLTLSLIAINRFIKKYEIPKKEGDKEGKG